MLTLTEENYLKAIFHLQQAISRLSPQHAAPVSMGVLAESMGVQSPTVTDMVRKLAERAYIIYEKSKGVTLTEEGKRAALQIIRRHRIWETFLARTLGFDWSQVHDLAEQLEHVQSEELISRLEKHLGYPKTDPHGDPIPDAEGQFSSPRTLPLMEATIGQNYVLAGVTNHSPALMHYLTKLGLGIGVPIRVEHCEAFDNSLTVCINQQSRISISAQTATHLLILSD